MSEAFAEELSREFAGAKPWRLPVFGQGAGGTKTARPHSAQHLDDLESSAHQDGFARGHAEGYAAGLAQARQTGVRLEALLNHLARPLADLDSESERALVALTIEMARRLAHLEMDLDPTRVAQVVREAVSALGTVPREVRVYLHPEDLEAVRGVLAASEESASWKLIADRELNRGDARLVTDGAQVDARLDTRQAELAQQLLGETR